MKQTMTLRLKAVLENIPKAMDCVAKSAQAAGFDEKVQHQIQLAVDEACANIVQHAYKGVESGVMEISCHLDDQGMVVQVRDWGKSFDLDCVPEPNVDAPLSERTLGGLGLFLIKQCMDDVQYTLDPEGGNTLRMVKEFQVDG